MTQTQTTATAAPRACEEYVIELINGGEIRLNTANPDFAYLRGIALQEWSEQIVRIYTTTI
jgi:hypothetical protein